MAVEIVNSIAAKISEYAIDAIVHQLGYLVHYKRNIKDLEKQAKDLELAITRVKGLIDEAQNQGETIDEHVLTQLTEVDKITEAIKHKNFRNGSCFNLFQRYRSSREANKWRDELAAFKKKLDNLDKVGYRGLLQFIESFESRTLIMDDIIKALQDPDIYMIGVYGMGGIGKTTLVHKIASHVSHSKLFEPVLMAVFGENPQVKNIQGQLADKLGFEFKEESEQGRAVSLRNRLQQEEKVLIIIDDVWNDLDLKKVGIPIPSTNNRNGSKIIVTSRSHSILFNEMSIEKNFHVENLTREESWHLFKNMVGEYIETNNQLKVIARKIVNKCGKLPITLVLVAKALKGKSLAVWKDALRQLNNPASQGIHGVIKLSYDHLESREAKTLFLLCTMFPDDYHIDVDHLSRYARGLKFLNGVHALETTRNRILNLIDDLESSCLLQKCEPTWDGHPCVKMHDLVRYVAISIASKDDQMCTLSYGKGLNKVQDEKTDRHYTAIFANCVNFEDLPKELNFSKLKLLTLLDNDKSLQIPEDCFEKMGNLKVLHLKGMSFSPSSSSFNHLAKLRTLLLIDCHVENIDMIGKLKDLEILDFSESNITKLPLSLSELRRLKQLKVSRCRQLDVIQPGVISRMTKLEELFLDEDTFKDWGVGESNNSEQKNVKARISELGYLPYLTCLYLCIPDVRSLPEIQFLNNLELERFHIVIGKTEWNHYSNNEKVLVIKTDSINDVLKELQLLERCEDLHLEGRCGVRNVVSKLKTSVHLRYLRLKDNEDVEYLVSELDDPNHDVNEGYSFKTFKVFEKLKTLYISNCDKMKYLFSVSMIEGLSNLESIEIHDCKMIEAIVVVIENEAPVDNKMEFRRLRYLELRSLRKLKSFCGKLQKAKGLIESKSSEIVELKEEEDRANSITPFHCQVKFPSLEVLNIFGLDQLEVVCDDQISTEFFPKLRVITFVNLAKIPMIENTNLHKIFRNLEELTLMSCMSDDFESVHRKLDLREYENVLPKLNALTLLGHSKLMLMWNKNSFVPKFPNLKELELWKCNTLRYIFTSSTVKGFPCLQTLRVELCSVVQVIDDASNDADAVLPQLKSLILNDLPHLTPFSNKHFVSKLECLETLIITQCPQMKTFTVEYSNTQGSSEIEIDEVNKEAEKPINNIPSISFFGDQVAFPCLVRLKLSAIDHKQIPTKSLGLLRELEVQNCSELREVFSFDSWRFKKLPCLEKLIVENCPWVREVFDFQGIISNDNESYLSLGKIKRLSLINLPSLQHFCKEEEDSPPSLFSFYVARHLVHLEVLEVVECQVEEIVAPAREENANSNMIIDFSRVHSVKLKDLPNLVRFCSDNKSMSWSNSLKTLEVEGCPKLETLASVFFNPPEEAIKVHEFAIVTLSLHDLDNLKEIWKLDHHPILVFNHLSCLTVQGCKRLRTLFTPTIAGSLSQLRDLIVDSCEIIGEIISEEISGIKKIELPQLKTIKLKHLRGLVCFLSGEYMLELPSLEHVRVEKCPQLQFFSPGKLAAAPYLTTVQTGDSELERAWEGDLESTIGSLFQGQVPYSEHEELKVIDPDEMKEILEMKLHYKAFRQLKKLHVEGCDEELRNFLSKLLFRFQELKELHVENCHSLELFNLERLIFEDKDEVFNKLEELTLSNLPKLMCVWNKEMVKYVSHTNLKRLDICGCGSLVNLFSPTKARDLQQLEVLNIHECDMMGEIFAAKEEGDHDYFQEICLPQLHHLQLIGLSNLKTFHSGNYAFELPVLKTLWIERCPKLKSLTPGFITTPKSIHGIDGISEESVKNKMVGFPRLERLYLKSLDDFEDIWQESVASESFTELQEMEIDDCGKLSNVIPHDMLPRLEKLERIIVKDCGLFRKVFDIEAQIINNHDTQLDEQESKNRPLDQVHEFNWKAELITVFENLQVLKLSGCYNLNNLFLPSITRSFVKDKETVNVDFKLLPKLKFLDLDLSSLTLEESHVPGQTLFEREFNLKNLEELHLVNLGSSEQIWDAKLSDRSLQKLKVISVNIGKKLLKIVPSNMLLGLLKLEKMYVQHCYSLKHIFDLDGITEEKLIVPQLTILVLARLPAMEAIFSKKPTGISVFQKLKSLRIIQCESLSSLFPASVAKYFKNLQELKVLDCTKMQEVIVADEKDSTANTIFPDLKCLVLKQLPQLTCFYGGNNDIEWRVLNEVRVKSNPRMKTFGHGSQIAPELKAIHVTFLEKHWKGGLNETIKFLHGGDNKPVEEDKAKNDKGKEIIQEPY